MHACFADIKFSATEATPAAKSFEIQIYTNKLAKFGKILYERRTIFNQALPKHPNN